MATIKQLQDIERKCGSVQMRMAVHQLFAVGYEAYRGIEDVQEVIDDVARRHAGDGIGTFMTEDFERAFQIAAWELAHTATIAEIICWCNERHYFEIFEWEEDDGQAV